MCLIIWRRKDTKLVNKEYLERAITRNPHGWGYSYWDEKEKMVRYQHSLNMKAAFDEFRRLERENKEFIFHVRWKTHGAISLDNCHPYLIGNEEHCYGVLFHNGTFKNVPEYNKDKSDTWHLCRQIEVGIEEKIVSDVDEALEVLLPLYNGDSRVITMSTSTGEVKLYGTVVKQSSWDDSSWVELEGNMFSNRYAIRHRRTVVTHDTGRWSPVKGKYVYGDPDPEEILDRIRSDWFVSIKDHCFKFTTKEWEEFFLAAPAESAYLLDQGTVYNWKDLPFSPSLHELDLERKKKEGEEETADSPESCEAVEASTESSEDSQPEPKLLTAGEAVQ